MQILIIEDDKELADSMKFQLEKEGYTTDVCHDGEEGLYYIKEGLHDLIILDRMLPSMDGISVLQAARSAHITTPVIFLTALGELQDKIDGLNEGADDYMVKPFAFEELLARIRSSLRRPNQRDASSFLSTGDASFDPENLRLFKGEKECTLSKREGALLEIFLRNPGQTLPRALLHSRVWGMDSDVEEGNLDNYVYFLRRRLKTVDSALTLKTVRGVGYCLEVPR